MEQNIKPTDNRLQHSSTFKDLRNSGSPWDTTDAISQIQIELAVTFLNVMLLVQVKLRFFNTITKNRVFPVNEQQLASSSSKSHKWHNQRTIQLTNVKSLVACFKFLPFSRDFVVVIWLAKMSFAKRETTPLWLCGL